jgi:purine-cytosine permease-like protein
MPSIDKGVQAFAWAVVFFLYIFFGMKAVGVDGATSLIVALVASFLIFLFVRTRGDVKDDERPAPPRR